MSSRSFSLLFSIAALATLSLPMKAYAKVTSPVDSIQLEYEQRRKALKRRYEAFLSHEERLREQEVLRLKGVEAHKKLRAKIEEKEEATRQKFVSKRKPPKDETAEEKKYLEQLKKREQAEESQRSKFVVRKNKLQTLLKNEASVPEAKEVGLE